MKEWIERALRITRQIDRLQPLMQLAARLYLANVFLSSGWVKISSWTSTLALFRDEYQVPLLPPELAATAATFGELFFPWLLVVGLAGRFGAAALFVVNAMAVISYPQLFQFDCPAGVQMHFFWGALLAALLVFGPGRWSVDALILRRLGLR